MNLFTSANQGLLLQVVEGLVFAADSIVTAERLVAVVNAVVGEEALSTTEVNALVDAINQRNEAAGTALRIEQWGGGYRMATTPEIAPYLSEYFATKEVRRLSRTLMETLAIIAYRQPITTPEIEFIRGVSSAYALKKLLEMNFVEVAGRSEAVGNPLLYKTTPEFLNHFGINQLENLPKLREIEELLMDPAFEKERSELMLLDQFESTSPQSDETPQENP